MASAGLHSVMVSSLLPLSSPSSSERVHSFSSPPLAVKTNFYGEALRGSLNAAGGHLYVPASKINEASFSAVVSIRMAQSAQEVKTASQSSGQTKMVVSIAGATGFVGSRLVEKLAEEGHSVRVLTRSATKARSVFPERLYKNVAIAEQADWAACIAGSTGVVNLAGTPISVRWTSEIKQDILDSRVKVTSRIVETINSTPEDKRPSVLINATAVGFYGTSEAATFDESSPPGRDYLAEVCKQWEAKAQGLTDGVRLVRLRLGIVLDKDGGALEKMVPLFQLFAGGPIGTGKQWFSWVHRDDLVNLIIEALRNPEYEGVINGTAPNPVRFAELCDRIGAVLGRPSWLPVPEFALKALLGEGAFVVLEGQRVLPKRAQQLGFKFKYQYVTDALRAILLS
ncbi:hypothetical protein R1sor_009805 [Riccia sorocarpa]|uniref:Uncharacterized protein n=1 Tax=Riccia sorocarpa TaxID=122646 RepID=A0ABD3HZJ6_9MARC